MTSILFCLFILAPPAPSPAPVPAPSQGLSKGRKTGDKDSVNTMAFGSTYILSVGRFLLKSQDQGPWTTPAGLQSCGGFLH